MIRKEKSPWVPSWECVARSISSAACRVRWSASCSPPESETLSSLRVGGKKTISMSFLELLLEDSCWHHKDIRVFVSILTTIINGEIVICNGMIDVFNIVWYIFILSEYVDLLSNVLFFKIMKYSLLVIIYVSFQIQIFDSIPKHKCVILSIQDEDFRSKLDL